MERGWLRPGRVPDVTAATVPRCDGRTIDFSPGVEEAGLGVDEDGGGVDLVPLGPEPAGPIGPAQVLRREVQLRCRDEQRLPDGQVGGALGHGNPIFGRGEADAVELAVDLSQDVGPREGGPALGDLADRDRWPRRRGSRRPSRWLGAAAGRCGPTAQLPRPQAHFRRSARPVDATPRSSRRGGGALCAGRVSRVARWRSLMISVVVGWRPWAATKAGISSSLRSSMAAARWENSARRVSGTPATSQRIWSEWRRDLSSQSHPNSWVNRSASTPWCSSPSITTLLNRPRESSVRHCPVGDRPGPVGHHHMVMELGVAGPRIPVGERGGHHALDILLDHAVSSRTRVEDLALRRR